MASRTGIAVLLLVALAGCGSHGVPFYHGDRLPVFAATDVFGEEFTTRAMAGPVVLQILGSQDRGGQIEAMANLTTAYPEVSFVTAVAPANNESAVAAKLRVFGPASNWRRVVDEDGTLYRKYANQGSSVFDANREYQGTMDMPSANCLGVMLNSPGAAISC